MIIFPQTSNFPLLPRIIKRTASNNVLLHPVRQLFTESSQISTLDTSNFLFSQDTKSQLSLLLCCLTINANSSKIEMVRK